MPLIAYLFFKRYSIHITNEHHDLSLIGHLRSSFVFILLFLSWPQILSASVYWIDESFSIWIKHQGQWISFISSKKNMSLDSTLNVKLIKTINTFQVEFNFQHTTALYDDSLNYLATLFTCDDGIDIHFYACESAIEINNNVRPVILFKIIIANNRKKAIQHILCAENRR